MQEQVIYIYERFQFKLMRCSDLGEVKNFSYYYIAFCFVVFHGISKYLLGHISSY